MKISDHIEQFPMLLTSLNYYPVILGVKWARFHGVKLDMHRNKIYFDSEYCLKNCLPNKIPLTVAGLPINDFNSDSGYESDPNPEFLFPISTGGSPISTGDSLISTGDSLALPVHHECAAFITTPLTRRLSQRVYPITPTGRHFTNIFAVSYVRKVQETRLFIPISNIQAFNVAIIGSAPFNLLSKKKDVQIFAILFRDIEKALEIKVKIDPRILIPEKFHSDPRFMKAFSKQDSDKFPPRRLYDYKIELEPGKRPNFGPLYGMFQNELLVFQKYLKENLAKGFIRVSFSETASPVLFARKPGNGLRFCVDYRGLNAITRKNRYLISLIEKTLRQLDKVK